MGAAPRKTFQPLKSSLMLCLMFLSCGMGTYSDPAASPLSIEGLRKACGLPAPCGAAIDWEGRQVAVEGQVDGVNVFDKRRFPNLPYEKFKLHDTRGNSLEVWAVAADNSSIFDKLARRRSDHVVVRGRLAAVKAPVMGDCQLGVKLLIDDADQIELPTS